jgi:hypothetical protein
MKIGSFKKLPAEFNRTDPVIIARAAQDRMVAGKDKATHEDRQELRSARQRQRNILKKQKNTG